MFIANCHPQSTNETALNKTYWTNFKEDAEVLLAVFGLVNKLSNKTDWP